MAIVAVLASILIPTAGAAHRSVAVARTKIQWSQWAAALESFRLEYGAYPNLPAAGKVNSGATAGAGGEHPFHDTLTGRRRDGSATTSGDAFASQNSRHIRFLNLTDRDWGSSASGDALLLADAFGNTDIAVVTDRNGDGLVNAADCQSFPTVSPPGEPAIQLRPGAAELGPDGARAGVILYSAPPGATAAAQLIMSWQ